MKKAVDFFISLFGIVCVCIATAVQAQSPNEVYRNEQIGIFIRAEGSEGGGDWMFVKATMFKAVVSFSYKGTTVTMTGYNSQRFLRKDYPFPAGLKLNDSQVMIDGYPATNYVEYLKYYDAMSKRVDAIGKNTNYDNKQSLEESITTIDNMIAEIKSKESISQISDHFKKQQNLRYFIQKLEEKRQSLKSAITALEKKSQASTIIVTGTARGVDKSNSSDKGNTGMRNEDFWHGGANKSSSSGKENSGGAKDDFWSGSTEKSTGSKDKDDFWNGVEEKSKITATKLNSANTPPDKKAELVKYINDVYLKTYKYVYSDYTVEKMESVTLDGKVLIICHGGYHVEKKEIMKFKRITIDKTLNDKNGQYFLRWRGEHSGGNLFVFVSTEEDAKGLKAAVEELVEILKLEN
ncbi:hypothetical protein [Sphingobacterium sp. xlx-130]|uniref:hypothetical protein n=1 Tax=Sphingobacterium sp. xlx-130 TaxID=2654323 RepID=UPI0013DA365A|nr:hypothetical protein [Sphingobacterium sp. xlx-130]